MRNLPRMGPAGYRRLSDGQVRLWAHVPPSLLLLLPSGQLVLFHVTPVKLAPCRRAPDRLVPGRSAL